MCSGGRAAGSNYCKTTAVVLSYKMEAIGGGGERKGSDDERESEER